MLNAEEGVLRAIIQLKGNASWDLLRGWIDKEFIAQSLRNNAQRDEVLLRIGQGRALCLEEIARLFNPAVCGQILEKVNKRRDDEQVL